MVWLRANLAGFPGSSSTTFPIGTWTSGTSRLSLSALTRRHLNATTLSCFPSRIETKKKMKKTWGLVVLPWPRSEECARAARLVLHQSNATQSKTRGPKLECHGGRIGITSDAIIYTNSRNDAARLEALHLGEPGPQSWATTSCGPWPCPTPSRLNLWDGRLHYSNWNTKTRIWGRPPIRELLDAHRERNGAVRGHTALGQQRRETVALSL